MRCPTIKYNRRVRAGRGFSLAELKVRPQPPGTPESTPTLSHPILNLHPYPPTDLHTRTDETGGIQEAGIPRRLAPTIGISIDPRRANLSTETLTANVHRLKTYRSRLLLFPRLPGAHRKADSTKEELASHENGETKISRRVHAVHPIVDEGKMKAVGEVKRSEMPEAVEGGAYRKLRDARSEARLVGVREKRAKAKAEEATASKK